jgi:iron(III) transport system substrate-binding protein
MILRRAQVVDGTGSPASVRPNVPGTLTTNDKVRVQHLASLAPDKVAAYVEHWNQIFRS